MRFLAAIFIMVSTLTAQAQILVEDPAGSANKDIPVQVQPKVGTGAAQDYFKKRETVARRRDNEIGDANSDRFLMLSMGTYLHDTAYRWGRLDSVKDTGRAMFGVTYRVGEWRNSMDSFFRVDLMSYEIDNQKPLKLSFMPMIAFPDVRSGFPLYFGVGAGVGVFFKQVGTESDLTFDYSFIVGARFPELFDWGGLFVESGVKNFVNLLSDGQFNGVYLSVGGVFLF